MPEQQYGSDPAENEKTLKMSPEYQRVKKESDERCRAKLRELLENPSPELAERIAPMVGFLPGTVNVLLPAVLLEMRRAKSFAIDLESAYRDRLDAYVLLKGVVVLDPESKRYRRLTREEAATHLVEAALERLAANAQFDRMVGRDR